MTGPTKILTVSYGTFSCTLEGFDDPLSSMREMAEYFRDLAADDRYFGAEPPQPDVEMLQRIAEKEVQRRVEARVSGDSVKLVASDRVRSEPARPKSETPKSEAPAKTARVTSGPLAYDDDYTMSDEPEDAFSITPDAPSVAQGPAESVAEKLRRIREVVSRNIELDHDTVRAEQAPNAGSPDLRERAYSETIRQIQDDLYDGEDTELDDGFEAEAEAEPPQADDEPSAQAEAEPPAQEDDVSEDAPETEARPAEGRSYTEVLGQVANRVAAQSEKVDDSDGETDDDSEDDAETETDMPEPHAISRTLSPKPDSDVGRLLNETDSKLNEDESVRRRRVISQMRAAVAATKADRMVSDRPKSREAEEEAQKNPYREDLSEAVEAGPSTRSETSRRISAPPLVLVSSQRIDSEFKADVAGAVAFARNFGASGLPELMEAAAAYTIFSEGQSSFTRPEIMEIVTRMDPALQSSREESLRLFGQLLRDGTFKKLERGQFTIDQGTRYNPGKSAADA